MARKPSGDMDLLPGIEPGTPSRPQPPKRNTSPITPVLTRARLILGSVILVLVTGLSLYGFQLLEQFLIRDARFAVAHADGPPQDVIRVSGASHASLRAIESIFTGDLGRSLYLVPLDQRLAALREVPWVRDASIARVWPNRLIVHVEERAPVAFLALPRSRVALIDADGVILPPAQDQFNLPLMTGVKPADSVELRREAVARLLRLNQELGDAMKDVSEIDVSQPENIAIARPHGGRLVRLWLGDRDYAQRYRTFLNHIAEIDARVPGATVMDLRLDDRITVVESEQ